MGPNIISPFVGFAIGNRMCSPTHPMLEVGLLQEIDSRCTWENMENCGLNS